VSTSPLNSACISINSYYSGEVEDYTVNIIPNIYPPMVAFTSPNTNPCNNIVSFVDGSFRNPQTWFWQFGDGSVSYLQNPNHQYINSGTYSVSLKTCNTNGCDSITKSNFVTINSNSVCSYCTPTSQSFFSIYAPIDDVKFNSINNTTGHASNIQYTDYSNLSTSVEIGKTYNLEINSSQNNYQYYYAWIDYNRDGNFDNSEQICSTYTNYINIPITISSNSMLGKTKMRIKTSYYYLSNTSLACADLEYGEVEDYVIEILKGTLKPNVNFTTNSSFNCTGEVYFEDLTTIQPTSWYWDFGDGNTSNSQSPFHKYLSPGQYDVTLKACNSNGCNTKKKLKYIVYTTNCMCIPSANSNFSYINTVNVGAGIGNTSTNNINGYQDFKTIQMDMYESNIYNVNISCSSIGSISGYLYTSVFIDLNRDNDLSTDELVFNTSSYNYGFNSSTYLEGNFTMPKLSNYGPTLMRIIATDDYNTSIDPCVVNANGEIEDYTVNLLKLKNTRNDIFVYPNPSSGKFTFYYEMFNIEDVNVKLVDISGHLILENNYSQASEIYENIDISAYNDGLYLLILTTPTTKNSFKVYKKD
jgi:PKD repeat protein